MTDCNEAYHGDHFEMYRNMESLSFITGMNTVLQVNYMSTSTNQTHKKRSDL